MKHFHLLAFFMILMALYAVAHPQKVFVGNRNDMLEIGESIGSVLPSLGYPEKQDPRLAKLYAQAGTTKPKFEYRHKRIFYIDRMLK